MDDELSALGESGLLRRLLARLPAGGSMIVGPGDDAAVLPVGNEQLLAAADLLVEGVHFDLAFSSPADGGYKALAVNVSDIAAMGGRPRFALVSLGVGRGTPAATLDALYDGLAEAAKEFDVAVAGGDTTEAPLLTIAVTVIGDPPPTGAVLRAGARPGDVLAVTGSLGSAAAGLRLLRARTTDPAAPGLLERYPALGETHRRGRARVREGAAAARLGAHAMIDLSDGLAADAGHVGEASAVGVEIDAEALPLGDGVAETAAWEGTESWRAALVGGDDYELAIALPGDEAQRLREAIEPTRLTIVGRFTEGDGVAVVAGGSRVRLDGAGWDPFRR